MVDIVSGHYYFHAPGSERSQYVRGAEIELEGICEEWRMTATFIFRYTYLRFELHVE
jgi:hypothetical protein